MRLGKRLTRSEKKEQRAQRLQNDMQGSGLFVFENNTDADLKLPKRTMSGARSVAARQRFQGDSYFLNWVGPPMGLLRLIEQIIPVDNKNTNQEIEVMNETKLILDQPDTVTTKGKIEHVVSQPNQVINDSNQNEPSADVLLNEGPLDGVEIFKA